MYKLFVRDMNCSICICFDEHCDQSVNVYREPFIDTSQGFSVGDKKHSIEPQVVEDEEDCFDYKSE